MTLIRPESSPRPGTTWMRPIVIALVGVGSLCAAEPVTAAPVHGGGVGSCGLCHIMHDAAAGEIALDGTRPLLVAASATDLCLTCHGNNGVFGLAPTLPPAERGAGNFTWLLEDNLNDAAGGAAAPIRGQAAGHSIASPARGTNADTRWDHAPGGTFPSALLGCTSCHDPHGTDSFRMLNGAGPVQNGATTFLYPAPVAEGLDITNAGATESRTQHTAYRSGMTQWCANCHGFYHDEGSGAAFEHPVDGNLDGDVRERYNRYEGDVSPGTGSSAMAYIPQVPFEGSTTSVTGTNGPTSSDRIMCLTCHRVHGSSAPASGRWDFRVYRLADDGVVSGSSPLPSPYPGVGQGQLCKKCHAVSHEEGRACVSCHGRTGASPFPAIR